MKMEGVTRHTQTSSVPAPVQRPSTANHSNVRFGHRFTPHSASAPSTVVSSAFGRLPAVAKLANTKGRQASSAPTVANHPTALSSAFTALAQPQRSFPQLRQPPTVITPFAQRSPANSATVTSTSTVNTNSDHNSPQLSVSLRFPPHRSYSLARYSSRSAPLPSPVPTLPLPHSLLPLSLQRSCIPSLTVIPPSHL